jgi:hypothetical protein
MEIRKENTDENFEKCLRWARNVGIEEKKWLSHQHADTCSIPGISTNFSCGLLGLTTQETRVKYILSSPHFRDEGTKGLMEQ